MSVQTLDRRYADLLRLQDAVEREITRVESAIAEELAQQGRRRRSRFEDIPCGTEQAYQRHRYRDEPIDDDCGEAHRLHNRRQDRRAAS